MEIRTFDDLYIAELQEARSVEEMLTTALQKMADAASDGRLKQAFTDHLEETREQEQEVRAIIARLGADPGAHSDQALAAIIGEADKTAAMLPAGPVRDAELIASAQRVEHYEMAVYGTLRAYAAALGHDDDVQILEGILEEEKDADDLLSDIAEGVVNPAAVEAEAGTG